MLGGSRILIIVDVVTVNYMIVQCHTVIVRCHYMTSSYNLLWVIHTISNGCKTSLECMRCALNCNHFVDLWHTFTITLPYDH